MLAEVPRELYVGGEWRAASGAGTLGVEDPATGKTLIEIADAQPDDALAALGAAAEMQGGGRRGPPASAGRSCGGRTRRSSRARTSSRC